MATFTLPEELRPLAKAHPKIIYDRLFKSASASLVKLGRDPKYLGGDPGMIGVLQTWDRQKNFHPHIHFILPGVALHPKGKRLCFSKKDFLIRTEPLANIFRAKLKDALLEAGLAASAPPGVWRKKWVVNIKAVGSGLSAFKYLVFYLFGGAISNRSLVSCTDQTVSIRYQDRTTGQAKTLSLDPLEFIRRILQHVPPKGFQRVRYYGFLASRSRGAFEKIADLLGHLMPVKSAKVPFVFKCPRCGKSMRLTDETPRMRGPPLEEVLGLISKRKVG
jgi:hypothetical protein